MGYWIQNQHDPNTSFYGVSMWAVAMKWNINIDGFPREMALLTIILAKHLDQNGGELFCSCLTWTIIYIVLFF